MTINIAVLTAEALVFGCDSIASTTQYLLDPFQSNFELDPTNPNSAKVSFQVGDLKPFVTNAWGGVTKMFELSSKPVSVAAVTAGLAKLNGRTIASLAGEFYTSTRPISKKNGKGKSDASSCSSVEEVATSFLRFMRDQYEKHYEGSNLPDELRDGPLFLVGGYADPDPFPSLFRVNTQRNNLEKVYCDGAAGVAWEGQSDSVERLLRGYDMHLRYAVEQVVKDAVSNVREAMAQALLENLQTVLDKLGVSLPEGMVVSSLPDAPSISLPWNDYMISLPYGNLPLQDAVDLAAFFVNLQSGKSKFAPGVATVGGRTHIGIVTRHRGFEMLDEPQLRHTNVGFN